MNLRDEPVTVYIALGSNLGEPRNTVLAAMDAIARVTGIEILSKSSLYASEPFDAIGPDYVNAVIAIQCRLDACTLLQALQEIEIRTGRTRLYRNAPRTLDLDVLLYGNARIDSPQLTVPHPRMYERAFVLQPLAEIAPSLVSSELLKLVSDQKIECLGMQ
jgi:2-amino-4-hydroxy-6-hydroxymethyldihydropteridine diphosphokinase